jgi:hypothetical protein
MALSLVPGQSLVFSGAFVNASGWWLLTVEAIDGSGNSLGNGQVAGQGSQSGLGYTIGPINAPAGTAISLRGTLQAYAAPYTNSGTNTPVGNPVVQTSGVIATVAQQTVQLGQVTGLSATPNGSADFNLSWTPAGPYTELQFTDATGTQPLGVLIGSPEIGQGEKINGNGTAEFDVAGTLNGDYVGFFTQQSTATATLPPGTTAYIRARSASGSGYAASFGPWTGPVEIQTAPGAPDLHIVNLTVTPAAVPVRTSTDPYAQAQAIPDAFTVAFQVQNRGTAVGYIGGASCAAVMNGEVFGYGNAAGYYTLQPGESSPQFSLQMMMGWVQSDGVWQLAPTGLYTVYVDWEDTSGNSSLGWAAPGATAGSPGRAVSVQVQFPGGSASGSFLVRVGGPIFGR